jgi:pimeloyl-ACP methyl ester carboxylesterase
MSANPTLVLVPGSWHTPAVWDKVIEHLTTQHFKCVPVSLPSCSSDASATFSDDIQAVHKAIITETEEGRDVVLVVWSYGGSVGNSAIKGLTAADTNGHGRVLGVALIASGFPMTGVGFLEATGGVPPPFIVLDHDAGYANLVADPRELFYQDLPTSEAEHWIQQLTKQSLKSLAEGGEHVYSGWKDVPTWYLAAIEDKALPVAVQRMFVQMAQAQGGDVTLREVQAGHAAMLSKPKECAYFVIEAARAFAGK